MSFPIEFSENFEINPEPPLTSETNKQTNKQKNKIKQEKKFENPTFYCRRGNSNYNDRNTEIRTTLQHYRSNGLVVNALDSQSMGPSVQNHRVTPRSTQPFILPKLIKLVPGISGNLMVTSKLPPRRGSSLETVEPRP